MTETRTKAVADRAARQPRRRRVPEKPRKVFPCPNKCGNMMLKESKTCQACSREAKIAVQYDPVPVIKSDGPTNTWLQLKVPDRVGPRIAGVRKVTVRED